MPMNSLRIAANNAKTALYRDNADDVLRSEADEAYRKFINELEAASNEDVTQLMIENPDYLLNFLYKKYLGLRLINKCDTDTINRTISYLTKKLDELNIHYSNHFSQFILLCVLAPNNSRSLLEALMEKADMELLMLQQRKMPYNAFLLNADSFYNEYHFQIYAALERVYKFNVNTNTSLVQKALYGMVSICITLPNTLLDNRIGYLTSFTYNNLETHNNVTSLFKVHKTSSIMDLVSEANPREIRGASAIIMAAGYLLTNGKKSNHKNLVKLLNKLTDCDATDSAADPQRGWYHLRMAELLGNFDSLALMSEAKKEKMLSKALNHAEHTRNFAASMLLQEDREGFNRQQFIDMRDAAENIIDAIRSHNPGKFPEEENNAAQIIAALKARIQATQWPVRTLFSSFPKHVSLMNQEIHAVELGIETSTAALRAIEKIARQATSEPSLTRYAYSQQFYQDMSNAETRNILLQLGEVQYRALPAVAAEADEQRDAAALRP